jgi:hypothetical protein
MPVNTNVVNAKAVFDALADSQDKAALSGADAAIVAEEFLDKVGTADAAEEVAGEFLASIYSLLVATGRSHAATAARNANDATVAAAADAAKSNF